MTAAIGARGRDERDSTTELVAEERDEDLRPIAARLRVGVSLGEVEEEEATSMSTPRQRSGPRLCLADCDDNGPPVPIQQQVQLLALDDKVKNKKKQDAKAEEQKSVMTFVDEGYDRAPIPVQQQMQQFDDAKEKTTLEISTASGAGGRDERDSTTELTAEEMEEGEVNLRPSVGSGVGESWGELEACVEVSSMPTRRNDAADARLAPEEEIPVYDGIVVPTVWTRIQTEMEHVRNWKQRELTQKMTLNRHLLSFRLSAKGFLLCHGCNGPACHRNRGGCAVFKQCKSKNACCFFTLIRDWLIHPRLAPQPTTLKYRAKLLAPDVADDDWFAGIPLLLAPRMMLTTARTADQHTSLFESERSGLIKPSFWRQTEQPEQQVIGLEGVLQFTGMPLLFGAYSDDDSVFESGSAHVFVWRGEVLTPSSQAPGAGRSIK
ncbi:hypothetical protein THAOC_01305 [Thalassiosira oceanica]|uniref:Uncharacterized protein n=1 Tax=Thalassiosira oceanica TaxID=159749 RepID=K0THI2_THAOC|nr:hypothetical protein THAOC_01305 [Thalassiosira oceanica]|eukprot:EJK76905.1 hypothetical protein THAOC_01305 [Thalassiosira oceanica]